MIHITAPHFCAGYDRSLKTLQFAPIIRWMQRKEWTDEQIKAYCDKKGWNVSSS